MELLVGAVQEALAREVLALPLGQEGDVDAGCLVPAAHFEQAGGETGLHGGGVRPGPDQQTAAGGGRERDRNLELRVVLAAGALVGLGPAAVEHVFAARMGFEVAG